MSANVVGRPARLRRRPSFPQNGSSPASHAGGRDGAVVTLVSRIYHELSIGQCTEEVARTLLKVLSEHGSELELHHRNLMSALMSIVYQHLLSAKDMLICVQLLQLIELRARNWRPNASADHFYHTQHSMLVEQAKSQQADGSTMNQGRGIVKTSVQPYRQYAGLPEPQRTTPLHAAAQAMIDRFQDSVKSATQKLVFRPLIKTMDHPPAPQSVRSPPDTGKELWQSLAQATSEKRSPARRKLSESGGAEQAIKITSVKGPEVSGAEEGGGMGALGSRDGSESGDSSRVIEDVAKQVKSAAVAWTPETGSGDAKSNAGDDQLSGGWASWQTLPEKGGTDDESTCSSMAPGRHDDDPVAMETGCLDNGEVASGEESFYSIASGTEQSLAAESDTAAEPTDDDDDDDDDDDGGSNGTDSVTEAPIESGAAAAAGIATSLLKYDRLFLIRCGRHVDARMLQSNWARLCSQFKDVCLSPQDARPVQLSPSRPPKWTLLRPGRY